MPIRFDRRTKEDMRWALPAVQKLLREAEKGHFQTSYPPTIRVQSNMVGGEWGVRGHVPVHIEIQGEAPGRPHIYGHYFANKRLIVLYEESMRRNGEYFLPVLLHELGHAHDFEHNYAFYIDRYGRLPQELRAYLQEHTSEIMAMVRPEAFPKKLSTPEERAAYLAKLFMRSHYGRELKTKFPRFSNDVLALTVYRYFWQKRHMQKLEGLLDEEKRYLRQLTERRAFTQTILQEVRDALENDRCGDPALLPKAGVWGTKCTSYMLQNVSPTYKRLSESLDPKQMRKVLRDVAIVLREEYFEPPAAEEQRKVRSAGREGYPAAASGK